MVLHEFNIFLSLLGALSRFLEAPELLVKCLLLFPLDQLFDGRLITLYLIHDIAIAVFIILFHHHSSLIINIYCTLKLIALGA